MSCSTSDKWNHEMEVAPLILEVAPLICFRGRRKIQWFRHFAVFPAGFPQEFSGSALLARISGSACAERLKLD